MNKKDFKRYMQQGLGRCACELKNTENITKYKDIVLWGCLHNLSYDTQCEGTRAYYVYGLTTFFNDDDYFVVPIIKAFENIPRREDHTFSHFCELLGCFAEKGSTDAKNALHKKYGELLSALTNKRRSSSYDFERDNFEQICITISSMEGKDAILRIAEDMGRLFRENPRYNGSDFDWFFSCIDQETGKRKLDALLRSESKKSQNILSFYENYIKSQEALKRIVREREMTPSACDLENEVSSSGKLSAASRVRFTRNASAEEKLILAESIISEPDDYAKAELLSVFAHSSESFSLSHGAIIEYSRSSCEKLRDNAFEVLTSCQSEEVYSYARRLLADRECVNYAVKMLLSNYKKEDKQLLLDELYKIPVDYSNESDWHSIGMHILGVKDQKVKLPGEFLCYIYETTLCSCCREYAVTELSKRRLLTKEMIEECRYDSNHSISEYVDRYYLDR